MYICFKFDNFLDFYVNFLFIVFLGFFCYCRIFFNLMNDENENYEVYIYIFCRFVFS